MEASETLGAQVLRRSSVQAKFKTLIEDEQENLAVGAPASTGPPSHVQTYDELAGLAHGRGARPWLIEAGELTRGQLLEIEVELEAEDLFKFTTTLSTMLALARELREQVKDVDLSSLTEAANLIKVFDQLLDGLVPLRGRCVDWRWLRLDDRDWLVHAQLVDQLDPATQAQTQPLSVVGVAETQLFWKDLRRVLFSNSRYFVFARLGKDGVKRSWTPVKLVHILESVMPEQDLDVGALGQQLMAAFRETHATSTSEESRDQASMRRTLILYGALLAHHLGHEDSPTELEVDGLLSTAQLDADGSIETERTAFGAITKHLEAQTSLTVDPEVALDLREQARERSACSPIEPSSPPAEVSPVQEHGFLDTEIVAIYW